MRRAARRFGAWATYSIYVNDVLIGTKAAEAPSTVELPADELPSGARIDIVVDCRIRQLRLHVYDA